MSITDRLQLCSKIDELFVREDCRNSGIASAFFEWLEKTWNRKAIALSIQVTPDNNRALAFYQSFGFENSLNRHLLKVLAM